MVGIGPFEVFKECGWSAWLCLLIGLAGIGVGLIGLVMLATRARGVAWILGAIAVLLGLGSMAMGMIGRTMGIARMEEALSGDYIDPSQRERIREVGTAEANGCVKVGVSAGTFPFLVGGLAVGVGLALRKKKEAT